MCFHSDPGEKTQSGVLDDRGSGGEELLPQGRSCPACSHPPSQASLVSVSCHKNAVQFRPPPPEAARLSGSPPRTPVHSRIH